jgi:hypothetical protein
VLTRRVLLALPVLLRKQPESPHEARIREAAAQLAELIRPRPKAFLHYHLNKFDIWVAATHLKLIIREAGMPVRWRQHYRIANAVAEDMAHATWECYPGCRHRREHEFCERIIDSNAPFASYETEIVS